MDCLLPLALSGSLPLDPPNLDLVPPPLPERGVLGDPPIDAAWGEHFFVTWDQGGDEAHAQAALDALELGWDALVDEQGWAEPVSSDDYLIRVILYELGGSGVTTEVDSELYPEGVPVIYLNPQYAGDADFWTHLAVHELAHALQFRERDTWSSTSSEAWYWEASAEWLVERALPDLDVYARTTAYYAWQPHFRYDSMDGSHQYGMLALNAWLFEVWGPDGLRELWDASSEGEPWLDLIGDPEEIWPAFTHAYGNGLLAESALYEPPIPTTLKDGSSGTLPMLGTHYLLAQDDTHVRLSRGDAVLSADEVVEGQLLAVTALDDDVTYEVEFYVPSEDSGDSGGEDTAAFPGEKPLPAPTLPCGCAHPASASWFLALLALGGLRRRR